MTDFSGRCCGPTSFAEKVGKLQFMATSLLFVSFDTKKNRGTAVSCCTAHWHSSRLGCVRVLARRG